MISFNCMIQNSNINQKNLMLAVFASTVSLQP